MKNIKMAVPAVLLSLVIIACGDKKPDITKTSSHETHTTPHQEAVVNGKAVLKDDKLNAVYEHYAHLTNALINENEAEAKISANAIEAGATLIQGGSLIASTAAKIVAASDLEEQRRIYADLSNALIALVKEAGMLSGELYVDYCPMAMNDKGGYWLSSVKPIRNPYFGDAMMSCGEVKDTIKAGS